MPGSVRAPGLLVTIDGIPVAGAIGADIQSNNYFAADRFRLQVAARSAPQLSFLTPDQRIEIAISLDDVWQPVILGRADSVSSDPINGIIRIEGRDLSSLLIDTQTDDSFANRTASEIATILAGRHGLACLAQPTATPVGRYYQSEHDRVTLSQFSRTTTEWDLLSFLATQEGFSLFMDGPTLHFAPQTTFLPVAIPVSECISLRVEHCVGLARPLEVTVKSWGSKSGATVVGVARAGGQGLASRRMISKPNLTTDAAQGLARRVVSDVKRHEWAASVTMPGDLGLSPRSRVVLVGTGSFGDRIYSVSQVARSIDVRRGFTQHLTLQGVA